MCVCPNLRCVYIGPCLRVVVYTYFGCVSIKDICPRVGFWWCVLRQSGMRVNGSESVWPIWEGVCLRVWFPAYRWYLSKGQCPKVSVCACRGCVFVVCMCWPAHIKDMIQGSVSDGLGGAYQGYMSKGRLLMMWFCVNLECVSIGMRVCGQSGRVRVWWCDSQPSVIEFERFRKTKQIWNLSVVYRIV